MDFRLKDVIKNDLNVRLQIWDTAGQDRFRTITRGYYRGSHGIFLIYDVTSKKSFKSINYWIGQISQSVSTDTIVILIANKADIESEERVITRKQGEELAKKKGLYYMECSAKTNTNVSESFNLLVDKIFESGFVEQVNKRINPIIHTDDEQNGASGGRCCK